ncbi:FMN-binding protein [Ruminococcus sp.]|uniref:FMN-binding protein n=1 Tax=Ruminococcus sp. TaxID=41978 RepID=UPI0025E1FF05|nr:FMN-binding protein [Ruminococcus sp.]
MNKNKLRKKRIVCSVLSAALLTNSFHVAAAANAASSYKDGTYTGTASGFLGDITVSITVTDGAIAAIDVTDQKDTPSYWERAEAVIPEIIAANGTEGVDAVSGASKNKVTDTSASIKRTADGDREITITDSKGNVLDKYTVDPQTGKGVNSANEAVDLPQTGINSMYKLFIIFGAFMMIGLGILCIKGSMTARRREE